MVQNSLVQYFDKGMKRKIAQKDGISKRPKEDGGGDSLSWDMNLLLRLCNIVVERVDYQSQKTISQLNRCFAGIVESNAQHQLKKFKRHIQEDKYM